MVNAPGGPFELGRIVAGRYAAPLSFSGSANRIAQWPPKVKNYPVGRLLAWIGAISLILLAWAFIATWYVLVFTFAGLWFIPYRLVRRGQRRRADVARS